MRERPSWQPPATESGASHAGSAPPARDLERMVFDSLAGGLVVLGVDGRVLGWNANAETLLGVDGARVRARGPARAPVSEDYRRLDVFSLADR